MKNLVIRGIIGILLDIGIIEVAVTSLIHNLPFASEEKLKVGLAAVMIVLFLYSLVQDIRKMVYGIREQKELQNKEK